MGWKATIINGKRAFEDMVRGLEYEILTLKEENMNLKKEVERLKKKGGRDGEP